MIFHMAFLMTEQPILIILVHYFIVQIVVDIHVEHLF